MKVIAPLISFFVLFSSLAFARENTSFDQYVGSYQVVEGSKGVFSHVSKVTLSETETGILLVGTDSASVVLTMDMKPYSKYLGDQSYNAYFATDGEYAVYHDAGSAVYFGLSPIDGNYYLILFAGDGTISHSLKLQK
ncbi:MAG: hypothetical protein COT73_01070 [Bdellovibrio sp. CG10_big_fil_rev_8_21_14_0_10_47_8]|nr:MAG: hypothetical protein COT73_01070 [Bdellovibrio sp. CG10_big_fil_rev_8_21_14_0_10_47_8]